PRSLNNLGHAHSRLTTWLEPAVEGLATNGLAVRASPRGWRGTNRLLERAGKCRLGVVANYLGNLREGRAGIPELLGRGLHAPIGEVVHRGHADQANEAGGQRRTR